MARLRYFEDEEITEVHGNTLWRVLSYLKPYKLQTGTALLLVLFAAAAAQVGPYLVRIAIDVHMPAGDFTGVAKVAGLYAILIAAAAIATRYRILLMVQTGNRVIETIRDQVFTHALNLAFKFFDDRPAGKIIVRIMNNVDSLQMLIKRGVIVIISDIFRLVIIFVFMFAISPGLTLIALTVTPLMAVFVFYLKRQISERWALFHKKNSNINAYTHERLVGINVTQSFVRENDNSEVMAEQLGENVRTWMRATRMSSLVFPVVLMFNTISIALVYIVGYRLLGAGTMTLGTIVAFGSYVWMVTDPIVNLSNFYNEVLVSLAAAERVFDLLDTEQTVINSPDAYQLPTLAGDVEIRNIDFAYEPGVRIFTGFNLRVPAGQTVAVVGETGAGKSTIMNMISRFYDIESGSILLDGHDIKQVTLESLRTQVGVMMQDPFVFSGTIAENIRYGRPNATEEEVRAAAEAVRAHEFIRTMPDRYETIVNEGGSGLSIGERQLIAFARTLLADPRVLILDEATASIDTQTERRIQAAIERLLANRTSFVVAHRLSTIRHADRILVIEDGRILQDGTHHELLAVEGKYRELQASQYGVA